MSELLQSLVPSLWQSNIELSLLLLAVLIARLAIRKTTKIYNAYLLWLSIPVGILIAKAVSLIEFTEPPISVVNYAAQNYFVQPPTAVNDWTTLSIIWAAITIALILRLLKQHFLLRKELIKITVQGPSTYSAKYPVISVEKEDFSPAVYGFLKPKIYFPVHLYNELSDQQIKLIISHEEHHITQQHLWLNLLWDLAVCLMWFNPLIYISRQGFRHDQELFCDYLVLEKSAEHDHLPYGHALLATVSATHSVSLLCSWKTFDQLEERIMNIKQSTTLRTKLTTKIAIGIFATGIIAGTSIYAVSATEYDADPTLSQSRNDDGVIESIVRLDDNKSYIDNGGKRYVIEGGLKRPISEKENTEFSALLEKSKNNNKDSLTHSVDENGEKIIWRKGKTHFIEENGKRFIKENDSTRAMTEDEYKTFKDKIKQAKRGNEQYRKAFKNAKSKQKHAKKDVSQNAHIDRNTETIIRVDGKSYVEENGERYIVEDNIERPMNDKENSEFKAMLKKSKNRKKEVLWQNSDDNGKTTTWRNEEIEFIEENGKRFVSEDGKRRPMTKAEVKLFEERIELAKREGKQYRKKKARAKLKGEQTKLEASNQSKKALKEKQKVVADTRFEKYRLKARANALNEYEKEFERARQKVIAKQKKVTEAQQSGKLSEELAESMLENLLEKENELNQQSEHVRQKIEELDQKHTIEKLRRAI